MGRIVVLIMVFAIASAAPSKKLKRSYHRSQTFPHHPNAYVNYAATFANTQTGASKDHYGPKPSGLTNSYSGASATSNNYRGQTFTGAATNTQVQSSGIPYENSHRQHIAASSAQTGVLGHGGFGYGASANVVAQSGHVAGYNYGGASSFTGSYGGAYDERSGAVANAAAQSASVGGAGGGVSATAQAGSFGGGHGYSGSVANAAVQSGSFGEYGNGGGYGSYGGTHGNNDGFDGGSGDSVVPAKANGKFKDYTATAQTGTYSGHNVGRVSYGSAGHNSFVERGETNGANYAVHNGTGGQRVLNSAAEGNKLFNQYATGNQEHTFILGNSKSQNEHYATENQEYRNHNIETSATNSGVYKHAESQNRDNKQESIVHHFHAENHNRDNKQETIISSGSNVHQRFHPTTASPPRHPCDTHRPHTGIDAQNSHLIREIERIASSKFVGQNRELLHDKQNVHGAAGNVYSQRVLSAQENVSAGSQGTYNVHEKVSEHTANLTDLHENATNVLQGNYGFHGEQTSAFLKQHDKKNVAESAQKPETLGYDTLFKQYFSNIGLLENAREQGKTVNNARYNQTGGTVENQQSGNVFSESFQHQEAQHISAGVKNYGKHEEIGTVAESYVGQHTGNYGTAQDFRHDAAFSAAGSEHRHVQNVVGQSEDRSASFANAAVQSTGNYHRQNVANFGVNGAVANSAHFNNQGLSSGVANAVVHSNLGQSSGSATILHQGNNYNVAMANSATQSGNYGRNSFGQSVANAGAVSGNFGNIAQASSVNQNHYVSHGGANSQFVERDFAGR